MCDHGVYNHQIYLECCKKYFGCCFCHNENNDHITNKHNISHIKCIKCNTIQPVSNNCANCNVQFAKKFCKKCYVWSNSTIEHCNDCNKCYINLTEKIYHCHGCNKCYYKNPFNYHKCSLNQGDYECQICFEKLKMSNQEYFYLKCNHIIHKKCYNEYLKSCKNNEKLPTCCLCRKLMLPPSNFEKEFDQKLENWKVLECQENWISYFQCNDCEKKNIAKYHPKYIKCIDCKSYNTNNISIVK